MDLMKNKMVHDFAISLSEDFFAHLNEEPFRFNIDIDQLPTNHGIRVITSITDRTTGEWGEAICNSDKDDYNYLIGVALAWARMKKEAIPRELLCEKKKRLNRVKVGEHFERWDIEYRVVSKVRDNNNLLIITVCDVFRGTYDVFTQSLDSKMEVKML